MKEMSWRKVLADRSCGDPRAYRLIQARSDKTSLRSADYVKSLCSTSEFGLMGRIAKYEVQRFLRGRAKQRSMAVRVETTARPPSISTAAALSRR